MCLKISVKMPDCDTNREDRFWHVVLASVVILSLLFPDNPVFNVASNALQALQDQPPVVVVPLFTALFVFTHSYHRIRALAVHHGFMGARTEIVNSHQSTLAASVCPPPHHPCHQQPYSHQPPREPSPQAKSQPQASPVAATPPQPEPKPNIVQEQHHPNVGATCKAVAGNEAGAHQHFPQSHHVDHRHAVLPPPHVLRPPEHERGFSPPRHMGPHQGEFPTRGAPVYRYPPGTEASKRGRQTHYIQGLNECNWVAHEPHVKKTPGKFFSLPAKDIPRAQISTDFAVANATAKAATGGRRWFDIFNQLYS